MKLDLPGRVLRKAGEFADLSDLCMSFSLYGQVEVLTRVHLRDDLQLPIIAYSIGGSKDTPAVFFTAGFHGLEQIGSRVVLSYMKSLVARLLWDDILKYTLKHLRLYFIPMVNPGGFFRHTRSNPAGIDLMRNAPVDAEERPPFLVGGHRIGPWLPYYRGAQDYGIAQENYVVSEYMKEHMQRHPFLVCLDCHSGFGRHDRIWFPYAGSKRPFENLADMYALKTLFENAYPHHFYNIEPQSASYTAHGDFWDWQYIENLSSDRTFLPLTLEMSSWLWVRKNLRQAVRKTGIFNPKIPHRETRVQRRHQNFMEFLVHAAASRSRWAPGKKQTIRFHNMAIKEWF